MPALLFTGRVQFELDLCPKPSTTSVGDHLFVEGKRIPLVMVRHPRARRYILQLRWDGAARLTIPRGGSVREGRRFAERHADWLAQQFRRRGTQATSDRAWRAGMEILLRGKPQRIEPHGLEFVRVGEEVVPVEPGAGESKADLRGDIERYLWGLAIREFPPLVFHHADRLGLKVTRVTVRNQRSRWGSCSRHGTISLNWRLVQAPAPVRDYIILHELCHLHEMNHSPRFWREVQRVCPDYRESERWLKGHGALLS